MDRRLPENFASSYDLNQKLYTTFALWHRYEISTGQASGPALSSDRPLQMERLSCRSTACCAVCSPPTPAAPAEHTKRQNNKSSPWSAGRLPLLCGRDRPWSKACL